MNKIVSSLIILLFGLTLHAQNENERFEVACVGFYNLENLFDTLNTVGKRDGEFTPEGRNAWNSEKYLHKQKQLDKVISDIAVNLHPEGLSILGVSEVENVDVLEDLVKQDLIKDRGYKALLVEGPDKRGVDVGMIYNPRHFNPESWTSYHLNMEDSTFKTRDQLLVSGELMGERIHVIVTHWPSRSGGQKRSEPNRMAAAELGRSIVDSIMEAEVGARIIYMGDLNDDPVNKSLTKVMMATGDQAFVKNKKLYNPMYSLFNKGVGSLAWRDTWNLFDQILLSPSLMDSEDGWIYHTTRVYNKPYLLQPDGNYKGYPYRTFSGGAWSKGYSDHFPVYAVLKRKVK